MTLRTLNFQRPLNRLLARLDWSRSLHARLAARRQIAVIWSIEDVQSLRPDLTDDQAWQVLQSVDRNHDCNHGITWETLETAADFDFPQDESSKDCD